MFAWFLMILKNVTLDPDCPEAFRYRGRPKHVTPRASTACSLSHSSYAAMTVKPPEVRILCTEFCWLDLRDHRSLMRVSLRYGPVAASGLVCQGPSPPYLS